MAVKKTPKEVTKTKRAYKRRTLVDPGEHRQGPAVVLVAPPLHKGGSLVEAMEYNVTTRRLPAGNWLVRLVWVDSDGKGNIVMLPDEVCRKLWEHHDRIMADCRSARAERAQQTVKLNKAAGRPAPGADDA